VVSQPARTSLGLGPSLSRAKDQTGLDFQTLAVQDLHIPLCFLIASRPEQDIHQASNDHNGLELLSFSIALDNTYQPDDDIQVFLQSTFDEIK